MKTLLLLIFISFSPPPKSDISLQLYQYFEQNVTKDFQVYDRSSNHEIVSVAATGFGMLVWAIAARSNIISEEDAKHRINLAFDSTINKNKNPASAGGWLNHFYINGIGIAERSTIDTAIFLYGAKRAAELTGDAVLAGKISEYVRGLDVQGLMKGPYIRHGFYLVNGERQYIEYTWDEYSEGVILYRLLNLPYQPAAVKFNLPLFTYYYPLCFFDDLEIEGYLEKAISYQRSKYICWGHTALDTEDRGYRDFDSDTYSPLTVYTLTRFLNLLPQDLFGRQNFMDIFPAKSLLTGWVSTEMIGIDVGSSFILLNKHLMKTPINIAEQ